MKTPLWEDIVQRLILRLGNQTVDIWIRPLRFLGMDGQRAVFDAPNKYYCDWISDNYAKDLAEELSSACGHPVELIFQTDGPEAHHQPPVPREVDEPEEEAQPPALTTDVGKMQLLRDKTFENFVVGSCNQFAHAACMAVAESPAIAGYNPLFIYGYTGLGKTHLVHSVGNAILARGPTRRVVYTTAEAFVNELINALRFKRMDAFRRRYRDSVDVLILDDVQFLSGKDRSQEEFFHTFQELHNSGRQIVLTADLLPRDIDKLENRLRTRFEGGLLADIQPPDLETMVAILRKKADEAGKDLPIDVASWLGSRLRSNIREAEGALHRLVAMSNFHSHPLTLEFARTHLQGLYTAETVALTADRIMEAVARYFNVRVSDLKGSRRVKAVARPRQIAMYLCRKHTDLSFPDLGRQFGGRDHSTVQHAWKKVGAELGRDPDLQHILRSIEGLLGL